MQVSVATGNFHYVSDHSVHVAASYFGCSWRLLPLILVCLMLCRAQCDVGAIRNGSFADMQPKNLGAIPDTVWMSSQIVLRSLLSLLSMPFSSSQ